MYDFLYAELAVYKPYFAVFLSRVCMFWKSQYGTKSRGYNTIRIMRSLVQKGLIGILQEVLVAHVKVI